MRAKPNDIKRLRLGHQEADETIERLNPIVPGESRRRPATTVEIDDYPAETAGTPITIGIQFFDLDPVDDEEGTLATHTSHSETHLAVCLGPDIPPVGTIVDVFAIPHCLAFVYHSPEEAP